ncbi:MAG: 4Fe-4S single cluster domain-containing protein [Bellilinea sp.]|jgi:anaerobic ribonucleoside-triphosphate reductase activating protein
MQPDSSLRVHHFEPSSRSNGPGIRAVLWLQGCTLRCPGCFNPHTHPRKGGKVLPVETIAKWIGRIARDIEGITLSGGEPLQQMRSVIRLLRLIRSQTDLSVILFSGYEMAEIQVMPRAQTLLGLIDMLIAGRYVADRRAGRGLVGSENKTVHCVTNRYTAADLQSVPDAEVIINPNGTILATGITPLRLD